MTEAWRHIEVLNHGSVVVLRPISDAARDWFAEHVGEAEYGGIYTCDPRMSEDILQAAARDLLNWQ
jgi:hypothetical protein